MTISSFHEVGPGAPGRSVATPSGPTTRLPFDPRSVDAMSDVELDGLVHGAIGLDRHGRILRYNLAEANLARLDRHAVIGRMFFEEVAPCTRTPEFEGAFRQMVDQGTTHVERFSYLFDFKFGAQECDVEMVRAPEAERFYVFVTRKVFMEARAGLQDGWAAPLQSELDGRSQGEGVLRDDAQQRVLRLDADFVATLFATSRQLSATAWPRLCFEWGQRWGQRVLVALEMGTAQSHGASLLELPFAETMQLVARRLADAGWGAVSVDAGRLDDGVLLVTIARSLVAEIIETGRAGDDAGFGAVPLFEGFFAAVFSYLSGKSLTAVEAPSPAPGDSVFAVFGAGLRPVAVSALSSGAVTNVDQLVQLLSTSTGGLP